MIRLLPNLLTLSRLPIALAIFILLSIVSLPGAMATRLLHVSLGLFVAALLTDIFDGMLARRLGVCTQNGRIIDALVDKVLICGTFVFFVSGSFVMEAGEGRSDVNVSGVEAWMVVVVFVRELLVTGLRATSEHSGRQFSATVFGKAKMTLQSISIIYILLFVARGWYADAGAILLRDILLWVTVAFTALSALAYISRAGQLSGIAPADRLTGDSSTDAASSSRSRL